ncbi:adenylate/guanylate cyclase domain-containing protein [Laspinema olomoucense]|uniref:HAMP domain-containing protein n=1 Tax=Laspinema olomoucense D3b TaxID=2953688 RepID=A0ABT2NBU5_9CYAN|nr:MULTISPECIES: adenylate/guanylate cyclase domain-containing protein [unclassified Laspinema]MCT7980157.1 HAMP domain-containing protein [Laspinema sp. D3b]MCT7987349.1 HAMP domain-containing protein [Laspinema sp. D3a]
MLIVPFVVQTFGAVAVVGYLSYRNGQKAVNDVATQLRNDISDRIKQNLTYLVAIPFQSFESYDVALSQNRIDLNNGRDVEKFLWGQLPAFPLVATTVFVAANQEMFLGERQDDGQLVIRASEVETNYAVITYTASPEGERRKIINVGKPNFDPRKRSYYTIPVQQKQAFWGKVFSHVTGKYLYIGAGKPIYTKTGDLQGVWMTSLNLVMFGDFLSQLKIGKTGQSFILERSGEMIATSTGEKPFQSYPDKGAQPPTQRTERLKVVNSSNAITQKASQALLEQFHDFKNIQASDQLKFTVDGQNYFVRVDPFRDSKGIDWLVVVTIPEADFMEQINANTQTTILLCLATLILVIVLGILTARRIIRPVERITIASEAIAQGNLNQQVEVSSIVELGKLANVFNGMTRQLKDSLDAIHLANEELEARVDQRTGELRQEKERSEQLLLNILPAEIAERLIRTNESPAEHFEEATILFADIVGFTTISARIEPMQLVAGLNQIFSAFDQLTEKYGLEKIKTIGDAYMVVGGLPVSRPDHAEAIANMALDMRAYMQEVEYIFGESLQIRIGINTGPVIAGVIGIKKFIYDLWGDAVNVASRMESHGKPGYIQVTDATYLKLHNKYLLEPRGTIKVKGRGEMMTYWLLGRREDC